MTTKARTADAIMADAQTDAFYLQGILQGVDIIMDHNAGTCGDERKAQGAITSLIVQAEKMAAKLGNDLDSLNLKEAAE